MCITSHLPTLNLLPHPVTLQSRNALLHFFSQLLSLLQWISYCEETLTSQLTSFSKSLQVCSLYVHKWRGKQAVNKTKIQVCTHTPVILFSGAASANPHGNTLQQNVTPKVKETKTGKEARPKANHGEAAKMRRHLCKCLYAYISVSLLPRGSNNLRAPDNFRESFNLRESSRMWLLRFSRWGMPLTSPPGLGISRCFYWRQQLESHPSLSRRPGGHQFSPSFIHSASWIPYIQKFIQNLSLR